MEQKKASKLTKESRALATSKNKFGIYALKAEAIIVREMQEYINANWDTIIDYKTLNENKFKPMDIDIDLNEIGRYDKRDEILDQLTYLAKHTFEYRDETKAVVAHLGEYSQDENGIHWHLSKTAMYAICLIGQGYIQYNTELLLGMKSKNAIKLYKLVGHNDFDTTYTLEEMNEILGTDYKRIIDLEKNILIPTKRELDETINCNSYSYIKVKPTTTQGKGRKKIIAITFHTEWKEQKANKVKRTITPSESNPNANKGTRTRDENIQETEQNRNDAINFVRQSLRNGMLLYKVKEEVKKKYKIEWDERFWEEVQGIHRHR